MALREQRLLAMAAGFLPCSGAILILVFALTNGILLTGLAMTLFIALGMGLTLALLGIASVLAHRQIAGRFAGRARLGGLLALLGPILIPASGRSSSACWRCWGRWPDHRHRRAPLRRRAARISHPR